MTAMSTTAKRTSKEKKNIFRSVTHERTVVCCKSIEYSRVAHVTQPTTIVTYSAHAKNVPVVKLLASSSIVLPRRTRLHTSNMTSANSSSASAEDHAQLARFEQMQHLSSPVSLSSLACLRNARLFLRGYSEMRQVGSWLHEALQCGGPGLTKMDPCQRALTPPGDAFPPASSYRNLSSCREQLYSRDPFHASCPALNVTLHYEWKSRMWAGSDQTFHRRVIKAAKQSPNAPVIVIINGGPHHFANFDDHSHTYYWSMSDSFAYPQRWFDSYFEDTRALFHAFAPRTLPPNTCSLWRTSNIGPRVGDAPGQRPRALHHPSARNGMHEWLNRWSSSIARAEGLHGVIDLTDLTVANPPLPKRISHSTAQAAAHATTPTRGGGAGAAHATTPTRSMAHGGGAGGGRRLSSTEIEGDLYHGYNSSLLLLPLVHRACSACALSEVVHRRFTHNTHVHRVQ